MLFTIERYVRRIGPRFVKRFSSLSNSTIENQSEEFILQPDDKFPLLRREDAKFLKVTILGAPNVGKSTLVNQLINRAVCPTSSKVHTTLHKARAVYCENDTQIVFMDTPGLVTTAEMNKYKLDKSFKNDLQNSIKKTDIIGVVQDVTNIYTRSKIHNCVLDVLQFRNLDTTLLLIFNKVDKIKNKNVLLELTRTIVNNNALPKFHDVFMISAMTGDGVDDLRNYLIDSAKPNNWQYQPNDYVDQPLEKIIEETVRAKLMDALPQEVPYVLKLQTEYFDISPDGSISTTVIINCPTKHYCKLLLKSKGLKVKHIAMLAEEQLRHAFRTQVIVKLSVREEPKV